MSRLRENVEVVVEVQLQDRVVAGIRGVQEAIRHPVEDHPGAHRRIGSIRCIELAGCDRRERARRGEAVDTVLDVDLGQRAVSGGDGEDRPVAGVGRRA